MCMVNDEVEEGGRTMKYIIDVPEEQRHMYDEKEKVLSFLVMAKNATCNIAIDIDAEPYTEPDRKSIEDEVWEFLDFLFTGMSPQERYECFNKVFSHMIVSTMSYQEAKAKYEAWKKQKDEIHVGDEIVGIYSDGEKTPPLVVLKVEGNYYYYGIYSKTGEYTQGGLNYEKTGRHFPEVAELLEKMRGEEE